ncbi:MAG: glycosyltransferase family 61 protein [Verrucomicrobiota bacterium]
MAKLPHGKVIGDLRLIATRENEVLGKLQTLHGIDAPEAHWALRQLRLRWPRRLRGTVAVLAAAAGTNYYHWLFDSLPRLHLLQLAGVEWNHLDFLLLNEPVQSFDVDSLALLGIPPQRAVRCSKRQITIADRLFVPPMPTPLQGQIAPWMCEFLRKSFLTQIRPTGSGGRLYLSRRNSPKRRMENEAEVESFFQQQGFTSLQLEKLSFREQVAAFAGASIVAGPHGAGFANLVFAPPATRVIELFHPGHQQRLYEKLATALGMRYQCVLGAAPGERHPAMSEKLGSYTIELEQVRQSFAN